MLNYDPLSTTTRRVIPQLTPPGQADAALARRDKDVPGAAHLRQQRDERAVQRPRDRAPPPATRDRRVRRDLVPLPRGSCRQTILPGHRHGRPEQHEYRRSEPQLGQVLRRGGDRESDAATVGDDTEGDRSPGGGCRRESPRSVCEATRRREVTVSTTVSVLKTRNLVIDDIGCYVLIT